MSRILINNTPADSGLGDSLKVSFDKVNTMTNEIYTSLSALSASTNITLTSQLTNDGDDAINPFISVGDAIPMSAITSLNAALLSITNNISSISASTVSNNASIATLNSDVNTINSSISIILSGMTAQNTQISIMQADIADIYNIINNL